MAYTQHKAHETRRDIISEDHAKVLTQLVEKYLALHLHDTALFLCEKLHDIQQSEVSRHLLACCYVYSGRKAQAIEVLRGANTPSNRYLRARYLLDLGRFGEAEEELTRRSGNLNNIFAERPPDHQYIDLIPNGAAGIALLGKICVRSGRRQQAKQCFLTAHAHDPFMWEAYAQLCEMGFGGEAFSTFNYDENLPFSFSQKNTVYVHELDHTDDREIQSITGINTEKKPYPASTKEFTKMSYFNRSISITSASEGLHKQAEAGSPLPSPVTPMDRLRWASPYGDISYGSPTTPISQGGAPLQIPQQTEILQAETQPPQHEAYSFANSRQHSNSEAEMTTQRRHEYANETKQRIANDSHISSVGNVNQALSFHSEQSPFTQAQRGSKSSTKLRTRLSFGGNVNDLSEIEEVNETKEINMSGWPSDEKNTVDSTLSNKAQGERSADSNLRERKKSLRGSGPQSQENISQEIVSHVRNIVAQHAHVEQLLSTLDLDAALESLFSMTPALQKSAWWWYSLGRIYFAQSKYKQAKTAFAKVRRVSPHFIEGCDLESTVLWQLKDQSSLSHLAHELTAFDPHHYKTWAAVGNAFSLSNEHHTALQFLERCIQLNPQYAYAYTLRGHEFISEEDLDAAAQSYRHAIRISPRHYNAWFGLGFVHYRQEQPDLAEVHFRKALSIYPKSPVLVCYLGMALHLAGKHDEAVKALQTCLRMKPHNTQAQLQLANVYKSLHKYQAARETLEKCVRRAGQEPAVRVLLGQVCGYMGDTIASLQHFNAALELAPKDANAIRMVLAKTLDGMNSETADIEVASSPSFL